MTEEKQIKSVYEAIAFVTNKIAKEGIAKDKTADTGNGKYKFRGIDDVYNALAPCLAEAGLNILPYCLSREVVERKSNKGNALFYVTVTMRFDFVSKWDGSKHEVCMYGEAMDSSDKATNKAMSAAYKYACMQTFCIPTEGNNDIETAHHEVESDLPLTTEQAVEIDLLIAEVGANKQSFLAYMKVDDVRKIKASNYESAKSLLEMKRAKNAKSAEY